MLTELLKTIFQKNDVSFHNIDPLYFEKNSSINIPKLSQVGCTILSYDNELFIALSPAA